MKSPTINQQPASTTEFTIGGDTIEIPRAWLERLEQLNDKLRNANGDDARIILTANIMGYIESAKALLNLEEPK